MKYAKQDDNRYRVRFMRSTEKLMDELTVSQFIAYLEENAELESDEEYEYLSGEVVKCRAYDLKEDNSNLHKEFLVTEDGRVFYWLSLNTKIELVDREEKVMDRAESNKRAKMVIVYSYIMRGFATKEEVAEEIDELLKTEEDPYRTLRGNIIDWIYTSLSVSEQEQVWEQIEKYKRYIYTKEELQEMSKRYQVYLKAGTVKQDFIEFETEAEAESFCKENGWSWIDGNEFEWDLDYEEVV